MNKKYYLVELDSRDNYYSCTRIFKATSKDVLKKHLNDTMATDMFIVEIKEIDFENNREYFLKIVSPECKLYSDYVEINE